MNGKYPPSLTLPERYSIDVLYVNQSALVFPEIVTSSPKRFDKEYVDHLSRLKNLNLHDIGRNISVGLKYSF
jgi:hypothetical protein